MERSSYSFIQLNTSIYLLQACESVSLQIRKKGRLKGGEYLDYVFREKYKNIETSNEFISLNIIYINHIAAVLEGTLRTLLCEVMQKNSEEIGELSISKKKDKEYNALVRAYTITRKYRNEVELNGGWDNLKRQYKEVLDVNVDKLLDKEKTEGINSIFTLRNIVAHGTAIVTPKVKLENASEGEYLFKWQSRLQSLSVYVKKEFGLELLDSLQHPSLCFHYTNLVKDLVSALRGSRELPTNSTALFNNLKNYEFGYRNHYEFPRGKEN